MRVTTEENWALQQLGVRCQVSGVGVYKPNTGHPNALVQAVPQLLEHAEITVEEFSRIGSSQMTPAHWLRLAKRVNDAFANDADLAGVVITHGTDTMEETVFFLRLRDPENLRDLFEF